MGKEVVADLPGILKVYSDESIVRQDDPKLHHPREEAWVEEDFGVAVKDVISPTALWLRLFLPPQHKNTANKLPIIIYFHGGGFCGTFFTAVAGYHRFCLKWAQAVGTIIVAVNYRVAPEHRLPAAYDDCIAGVEWVGATAQSDEWLNSFADMSRVYLLGDSAGGNIVHHVMMKRRMHPEEENPLKVKGAIMVEPFFGSEARTQSEINCSEDAVLSLAVSDWFWKLSLPDGIDRNHPFCNPLGVEASAQVMSATLPKLLVVIGGCDLLCDKDREYCESMKKFGKQIQVVEFEEEEHGFYALKLEGENSHKLLQCASHFIRSDD